MSNFHEMTLQWLHNGSRKKFQTFKILKLADFEFLPIVKLLNPPSTIVKRRERLEEFELYWQENLVTYEPYGMNKKTEIEKARQKMKNRLKRKEQ